MMYSSVELKIMECLSKHGGDMWMSLKELSTKIETPESTTEMETEVLRAKGITEIWEIDDECFVKVTARSLLLVNSAVHTLQRLEQISST